MTLPSTGGHYENVNMLMRVLGVEPVLRSGCVTPVLPYARPAKFRISQLEVAEVLSSMKDFDDWPGCWEKSAKLHETIAEACVARDRRITARDAYLHASYIYHLGQLYARDHKTKQHLHLKSVETYRAAGRHFTPPLQEVKIRFGRLEVPGYLRVPIGKQKVPWVLLVDGADATKEEAHYQAEAFLERGMGVFYFDGPGQGELAGISKVNLGCYERTVSEITRALIKDYPVLNPKRVGIYGVSTGGYLALRVAGYDDRIKAIVSVGGFYDARGFLKSPKPTQESLRSLFGLKSISETARFIAERVSIEKVVRKIRRPLLVVYGSRDHLVPRNEIDDLVKASGQWATLKVFREGTHALQNVDHVVRPMVADWMASSIMNRKPLDLSYLDGFC